MDFNQSQHHDDHMEWVPSLPEFHVDWSMYFDDTGPEGVRGDASTCEEAKAQSSDDLKIATWKLFTEAVERMLAEYSAEPSNHRGASVPLSPSATQVLKHLTDLDYSRQSLANPYSSPFAPGDLSENVLEPAPVLTGPTPIDTPSMIIGTIYRTTTPGAYTFRCDHPACGNIMFGRFYELKRHYDGAHASLPAAHWCDHEGCPRSAAVGGRPFRRKDKLKDHIKRVHRSGN